MTITREDLEAGRVDLSDVIEPGAPRIGPIHPGEHLAEFMADYGLSARALARDLNVPHNRILEILAGKRSITAETALRLARYFGTSARLWLGLQADYDRELAELEHGEAIAREVKPLAAA